MLFTRTLFKTELKAMFWLSLPLIITGFIESSISFTSTFFLAKLGVKELAAGSLVAWFFATLMIILWGVFMAVSVVVSHAHGAQEKINCTRGLRDGILLGLILAIPCSIVIWNLAPILILFGQNPETIRLAVPYMYALAWSPVPDFLGLCLLQFVIGLGHTRTNLIITGLWVPVNIVCNYVLIFGKLGFPALGIAGLGWGTTISYTVCAVIVIAWLALSKTYRTYFVGFHWFEKPKYLWELIKIGLPIGLMWFVEVSFFFILALIMGHYSLIMLDANQIVMQYVSLFVAAAFAIAQAITVRMGHQIGAKNISLLPYPLITGVIISVLLILFVVLLYWFLPNVLIDFDLSSTQNHSQELRKAIISLLKVAALFQFFEAIRISFFGALRGLKDTRFVLFTSFIAYWCISLPLGYWFANSLHLDELGYWWAMSLATVINIALLWWRYRIKLQRYLGSGSDPQPQAQ